MNIRWLPALLLALAANKLSAQQGSVFMHGFARMAGNGETWYIDAKGEKAFDEVIAVYHPVDSIEEAAYGHRVVHANEKETMRLVKKDGRMGVVSDDGKWLLPPQYDTIAVKWESYLLLSEDGKMTYADTRGKLLLPLRFQDAGILDDDHFDVKENGKWGVFSVAANKLVIPAVYEAFDYCGGCGSKGDYVFAQQNGKWGVVTFRNEVLAPFAYEHAHTFMRSDNWVLCFKKNGQDVVLNLHLKKEYGAPGYTDMELIGNGLLKVRSNGRCGLINEEGKVVSGFVYDDVKDPYGDYESGPFLLVTQNKKTGVLREDGRLVIPPAYDGDITCYGDYFIVSANGRYNLLDTTGKKLLEKDYNEITGLETGNGEVLFKLKQKALYGFYNPLTQKTVTPAFFDIEHLDATPLLKVSYQEKNGLYNTAGEQLLPAEYSSFSFLQGPFLAVKKYSGAGLYNLQTKKEIIPAAYYRVEALPGNSSFFTAEVEVAGDANLYGIFNDKGAQAVPPVYSNIREIGKAYYLLLSQKNNTAHYALFNSHTGRLTPLPFREADVSGEPGLLIVNDGRNSYLWDAATRKPASALYPLRDNGKGYTPVAALSPFVSGLCAVVKAGKTGFINARGEVVIPFVYDDARIQKNGAIMLMKQDGGNWLYGYADTTGRIVVPVTYSYNSSGYTSYDGTPNLLLLKKNEEDGRYLSGIADRNGHVLLPPVYDQVLTDKQGHGFLAGKNRHFQVFGKDGKPVTNEQYDDVLLEQGGGFGVSMVSYGFPLLCRKGEHYEYICEDGTKLPVKVEGVLR